MARAVRFVLATSIAGVLGQSAAKADTIYWDGTGTGWDVIGNWSTVQTAGTPDPLAVPGAADVATFVTSTTLAAQTVNLNGTQSALGLATNASNTFLTTLLGGGTNQTLQLGTSGINHVGGGFTIGSATAGQQVAISLQGAQTWNSSATGTGAFGLLVLSGVSIGAGGDQTLTLSGTNTGATISGPVSDGAAVLSILKSTAGTWILSGANSYTGTTTVSAGVLNIQSNTALGSTAGGTSVSNGAALQMQGGITVTGEALTLVGDGIGVNPGALRNISGSNTWAGSITISPALTTRVASDGGTLTLSGNVTLSSTAADQFVLQGNGSGVISGDISGASRVTHSATGTGTWVLSGTNTYAGGTAISNGTIQFAKRVSFYNGDTSKWIVSAGASVGLQVSSSGTVGFNVGGTGEFDATDLTTLLDGTHLGASVGTTGLSNGAKIALDTTNAAGGTFTYAGNIGNFGANAIGLTKLGTNTLELSGANTYSGATTVAGGTLVISGTLGATAVTVSSGTVLQLRGAAALATGSLTLGGGTLQLRSDTNNDTFVSTATTITASTAINVDQLATGTNNTLRLGAVNFTPNLSGTITVTGGNGYGLSIGALTQTSTGTSATTLTINNSVPVTIASFATNSSAPIPKLSFTGTGTATITGNITQSGTGALALDRSAAAGTLILQGTSNMTGAVAITNGTIQTAVATNAFGSTSGIGIGGAGILALRGDNSATFGNGVTPYPITVTSSGATINVDQATVAGAGQTFLLGTVGMAGAYTLNASGNNNTSLSLGAITGSTAANKTIANAIAGGGSLTIASYAETDASARTVTFSGVGNTTVTGTISQNAANALALIFSGPGTLTLNGANTYTGTTTISGGTLSASNIVVGGGSSNLGNATSAVVLGTTGVKGTLSYTGTTNTYTRGFGVTSGGGEVDVVTAGQTLTIATGNIAITSTGTFTAGGAGDMLITSAITGTTGGRVAKNNAGTLTLSGTNTYTGGATLNAGTLNVNSTSALGVNSTTTGTFVINGGTLNNTSGAAIVHSNSFNKTFNGSFSFGDAGSTSVNNLALGATNGTSGAITIGANISITVGGSATLHVPGLTLSGGTNTLTKLGTGTLAFGSNSAADLQSGTIGDVTVSAGTLVLLLGGATPLPTYTLGDVSVAGPGVLALASANATPVTSFNARGLSGAGTITTDNTITNGLTRRSLVVGNNNASATFSGTIADVAADGTLSFSKSGTGTQILSGTSSYSGNTVVNAGTLQFAKTSAFYNSDASKWVAKANTIATTTTQGIYVASGATLGLNVGGTGEFSAGNVATLLDGAHLGASTGTTGLLSGSALGFDTTNAAGGVFSYTTAIANPNSGTNALGVTKLGTNALELTAANTYTGATTVKAGTLIVSGSISASSAVTVGDAANLGTNAVLGGIGTVGNVTVGAGVGNTGATLNPHAGSASTSAGNTFNTSAVTFADGAAHLSLQLGRSLVFTTGGGDGATGGDVSDHLKTTGTVTLNGADLQLSLLTTTGYSLAENDVLFLIINGSGNAVGGTFSSLNGVATNLSEGAQFSFNSQFYAITYHASFNGNSYTGGNDVALMVVPEPGAVGSLLGGLGLLLGLQRRRRRK